MIAFLAPEREQQLKNKNIKENNTRHRRKQ